MLAPLEVRAKFDELRWGNVLLHDHDPFLTKQRARLHNFLNLMASSFAGLALTTSTVSARRKSQLSALYDTEIGYLGGLPQYPVLGFVSPRVIRDEPVSLPPDAWEGSQFEWDTETVKCGSLSMERLRLVDLEAIPPDLAHEWSGTPEARAQAAANTGARSKPGRKSAEGPIFQFVDRMVDDEAFRLAPQKVQLEMVLAQIRGKDPALDTLLEKASDKTLKGHISRRLSELSRRS